MPNPMLDTGGTVGEFNATTRSSRKPPWLTSQTLVHTAQIDSLLDRPAMSSSFFSLAHQAMPEQSSETLGSSARPLPVKARLRSLPDKRAHITGTTEPVAVSVLPSFAPSTFMPESAQAVNDYMDLPPPQKPDDRVTEVREQITDNEAKAVAERTQVAKVLDEPVFRFAEVHNMDAVEMQPPANYGEPPKLLAPSNRREILMFESMREKARKEGRRQTIAELRLASLMRSRYPNGVCGVEGPATLGTKVYATPAAKMQQAALRHQAGADRRRQRLAEVTVGEVTHGFDWMADRAPSVPADAPPKARKFEKVFQAKQRAGPTFDTHDRLFGDAVMNIPNAERTQRLRNIETRGVPTYLTGNHAIREVPPDVEEARRPLHPSTWTANYSIVQSRTPVNGVPVYFCPDDYRKPGTIPTKRRGNK